ncbi:MAG: sterol desaturase family protein [Bdellovibrio sp.]
MKKIFVYPTFLSSSLILHFALIKAHFVPIELIPSLVFLVMVIIMVAFEKVAPYRKDWNVNIGDFSTDIIQTLIVLPFVAKVIELLFKYAHDQLNIQFWSDKLPFLVQVILVILFAEFLFYWYHRFSHTNRFLLKFHAVHHGATRVYWANAGRFHFIDLFFQFSLYFIPVYLLGAKPEVASLFLTLNAITGTLEHTNIDFKTIFLARIFNTAELHRIHHSKVLSECNSNYGKILSVYDTLFGTYKKPKFKRQDLEVGLPKGRPVPVHFLGQIKYPFTKKKTIVE